MSKKFQRVVLHIGPDKTGSTAIQSAFFSNRDLLLSHGIMYSSGLSKNDKYLKAHFCTQPALIFSRAILKEGNKKFKFQTNEYIDLLIKNISKFDATELVLSHEGLVHLTAEELVRLREWLMGFTDTILVVMYVREPFSYARSAMSQRVKLGRGMGHGLDLPFLEYKYLIEKYLSVFGESNLNVRKFDRSSFPEGNVILDFLSIFNFNDSINEKIAFNSGLPLANISLSLRAMLVGDRIILLLDNTVYAHISFKELFLPYLAKIDGGKFILSNMQRRIIRALSKEHTQYLKQKFSIEFDDRKLTYTDNKRLSHRAIDAQAKEIIADVLPEYQPPKTSILLLLKQRLMSYYALAGYFNYTLAGYFKSQKHR